MCILNTVEQKTVGKFQGLINWITVQISFQIFENTFKRRFSTSTNVIGPNINRDTASQVARKENNKTSALLRPPRTRVPVVISNFNFLVKITFLFLAVHYFSSRPPDRLRSIYFLRSGHVLDISCTPNGTAGLRNSSRTNHTRRRNHHRLGNKRWQLFDSNKSGAVCK